MRMFSRKFNPFKDFQSDQVQKSYRKIFAAHYACGNAYLNLTLVMETTNGFTFQMVSSLVESWGVRLTCLDCMESNSMSKILQKKHITYLNKSTNP